MWLLNYAGNKEEAANKAAKANQLYPEHQLTKWMNMYLQYHAGNYSPAIEMLLKIVYADENDITDAFMPWLVSAYSAIGDREEARKWLAQIENLPEETPYRSLDIALAHAGLGQSEEFFRWANRAFDEKLWQFGRLRLIDREIHGTSGIRQDPRFIALFKKVGLEA